MAIKIQLQPKQQRLWQLWDDSITERIGSGGSRGGAKSGGGRRCMVLRRIKYPKTTGLILRRTYPELYSSHITKMFEEIPESFSWWNAQNKEFRFPEMLGGGRLFMGSAQHSGDMSSFYSSEYADIFVDEAQEFSQYELEHLMGSNRCTSNRNITSKTIMSFMPGMSEAKLPPKGLVYLKRVFVDHKLTTEEQKKQWDFVQAHSWDNMQWCANALEDDGISVDEFYSWEPNKRRDYCLLRAPYVITLSSMTDKALRDAWLDGKWDVFQGQYYPNFDQSRHVWTRAHVHSYLKSWHKRWISMDWGVDHPAVTYKHSIDENGHVLTYGEDWGRGRTEKQLAADIATLVGNETMSAFPSSWDAGKLSKNSTHEHPRSIRQMLNEYRGKNVPISFPADATAGSRISGARLLYQMLDSGMWHISEDCPRLIECLPTLLKDPKNPEDVLKVDWVENEIGDDPYDAARMGLQYMCGATLKPENVLFEEKVQAVRTMFIGSGKIEKEKPGVDWFSQFGGQVAASRGSQL